MKGIAFVYDPDGYWVELVKRGDDTKISNECNFSQTMLRIKDPEKSLAFYKKMGMKLLEERHFSDFSLFFMGSSNVADDAKVKDLFNPVLELTHNHGTEKDDSFKHYTGNEDERKGFGHIGFLVDDVYEACDGIREMGYGFKKVSLTQWCFEECSWEQNTSHACFRMQEPDGGSMKGLAFAYDPDGYWVEIVKRGGIDFGDVKVNAKK